MSADKNLDLVEQAYSYKVHGTYPDGCTGNQKRSIRRKAAAMVLRNGELFLTRKEKDRVVVRYSYILHVYLCT